MTKCAVLLSGGLDSAVLVADEGASGAVQPIYVRVGLAWEEAEQAMIERFLASPPLQALGDRVRPMVSLGVDMRDVYARSHWAVQGRPPAYDTPDEDVYLPGRNVVLLGKSAVFCAANHIERLVLGTLAHNPFPDATPEFRAAMTRALSLGLACDLRIEAPYAGTSKADVIRRGAALGVPFELTLSCMSPHQAPPKPASKSSIRDWPSAMHCGVCSKCRERHDAFVEAGVADTTAYVSTINLR